MSHPMKARLKRSIDTAKPYQAIAAVTTQTLAVGYWFCAGIDLIDLSGRILRQLSSTLFPCSMLTTPDGFLMVPSHMGDSIAKMNLDDKTIVFHHKVEQIKNPRGIAYAMDGSLIVVDETMRTLHLIRPNGVWLKKLWTDPGGQDADDELWLE
ncbi:hypothetical protein RRG08_039919 [Elysia crispata]|uniref:Uncharacterized protein n=1 Tax=Elysia crispata TaxID=231223 RepID=A0AAE1CRD5_9GAST|nr:hypothetical protein RRG08_039919 [Elysia crispata]